MWVYVKNLLQKCTKLLQGWDPIDEKYKIMCQICSIIINHVSQLENVNEKY
jgi:hypothetical protein